MGTGHKRMAKRGLNTRLRFTIYRWNQQVRVSGQRAVFGYQGNLSSLPSKTGEMLDQPQESTDGSVQNKPSDYYYNGEQLVGGVVIAYVVGWRMTLIYFLTLAACQWTGRGRRADSSDGLWGV